MTVNNDGRKTGRLRNIRNMGKTKARELVKV
jgi:hypothetical protein